ncbi:MAG: alkaline shock response membrane anchor protein AmaP [Clostridia bacterium]|nr:alkaline shock response membrane anchor protein AmaP [Clostridia bacterium]
MRFIDRLISFLFDIAVIVLAFAVIMVMTNVIGYSVIEGLLKDYVFNFDYQIIIISIAVVVILLGLKITVFSSVLSSETKERIFVDTPHGKIQINQETIEGIAKNVIKNYEQVKDVQARMAKAKKGINMYMVLQVYENTNIKDIVTRVQNDVKSQIVNATSIDVKNVDVRIKNVVKPSSNKSVKIVKDEVKPVVSTNTPAHEKYENNKDFIISQESDEYMKDENDVLYQVKSNEQATVVNDIDIEKINDDNI